MLLKNTLTRQVYVLSPAEWASVQAADLSCDCVWELMRYRFLVERGYDEAAQYDLILRILRTMEPRKPGLSSYTILPTTGCNARCVYCYEEGWTPVSMTARTADDVAAFICRTKGEGPVRIEWFGGEPLLGADRIARICRGLQAQGVAYTSAIITNGTLLTADMAREAVDLWHLRRAQVSMDGGRADYEARKRYVDPTRYNYDGAMAAVELLSDAGVNVVLRVNYDGENLPRVQDSLAECRSRFAGRRNVSIYMEQLFQSVTAEENAALYRAAESVMTRVGDLDLEHTAPVYARLKTHYCMVDSDRSVIIDPKGGLHRCEHDVGGAPFGTIYDEALVLPKAEPALAAECRGCVFLPDCMAFCKACCPVKVAACRTRMEMRTVQELKALLRGAQARDEAEEECP